MADEDKAGSNDESASADDVERDTASSDPVEPGEAGAEDKTDGDRVPEPVGARSRSAGATSASGATAASEVARKNRPTPKRDGEAAKPTRTGPVTFIKESVAELRKVVYPTGQQLVNYFIVVLVFVLFVIAYVSLLDLGIGAAVFRIFA